MRLLAILLAVVCLITSCGTPSDKKVLVRNTHTAELVVVEVDTLFKVGDTLDYAKSRYSIHTKWVIVRENEHK